MLAAPQAGQDRASAVPHCLQRLAVSRLSVPQFPQVMPIGPIGESGRWTNYHGTGVCEDAVRFGLRSGDAPRGRCTIGMPGTGGQRLFQRPAHYGNRFWVTDEEFQRRLDAANGNDSRFAAATQWQPTVGLREGLARSLDFFRTHSKEYWA